MEKQDRDKGRERGRRLFEKLGYQATPITLDGYADLRVEKESQSFIVEVKERNPTKPLADRMASAPPGVLTEYFDTLGKSPSLSGDVEYASRQIARTRTADDQFGCLLIFLDYDLGLDHEIEVIFATLYGTRNAFLKTKDGEIRSAPVIYAGYSDFFRFPDLDCVLVIDKNRAALLCNPTSPRISVVRKSALYKEFQNPYDPTRSDMFLADFAVDRKDPRAVCAILSKKYGHEFINLFDLNVAGAGINVPRPPA